MVSFKAEHYDLCCHTEEETRGETVVHPMDNLLLLLAVVATEELMAASSSLFNSFTGHYFFPLSLASFYQSPKTFNQKGRILLSKVDCCAGWLWWCVCGGVRLGFLPVSFSGAIFFLLMPFICIFIWFLHSTCICFYRFYHS